MNQELINQIEALLNAYYQSGEKVANPIVISIESDAQTQADSSDPKDSGKAWKCCTDADGNISCKLRPKDFRC